MKRRFGIGVAIAVGLVSVAQRAYATTRVCVSVEHKSWYRGAPSPASAPVVSPASALPPDAPIPLPVGPVTVPMPPPSPVATPPRAPDAHSNNPHEVDPTLYLKRMLQYEVTHEPGFAAVDEGCTQRLTVELYPLESGWTVF